MLRNKKQDIKYTQTDKIRSISICEVGSFPVGPSSYWILPCGCHTEPSKCTSHSMICVRHQGHENWALSLPWDFVFSSSSLPLFLRGDKFLSAASLGGGCGEREKQERKDKDIVHWGYKVPTGQNIPGLLHRHCLKGFSLW